MSAFTQESGAPAEMVVAAPSKYEVSYVIALFFLANLSNYADRYAVAALAPLIKADLAISDSQLGILTGLAFALFYAVCGIPLARLADRHNRRNILAWSLTVWSAMTALCGVAHNFWHMLLARIGVGVGEAGALPTTQTMLCDYLPLERRPAAFAMLGLGSFAGMAVGLGGAGYVGEAFGWRWAFLLLGIPGVLLAFIVRLTVREPERGRFDQAATKAPPPMRALLSSVWRVPAYRLLVIYAALNGFAMSAFGQWWPSYFNRLYAMDPATIGLHLGVIVAAGSAVGVLVGGLLANKLVQRSNLALIWIPLATISCAAPAALASLFAPSAGVALALVLLVNFLWSVPNGPITTAIYLVCPAESRASAAAILFFVTAVVGLGLGPVAVGVASDVLASYAGEASLRLALLFPTGALLAMTVILVQLLRTFPATGQDDVVGA